MTISQALNIESSEFDNLCTYFTDELKNPSNWTFPVTSMLPVVFDINKFALL